MLASRLLLSMAVLGLAVGRVARNASAQDPKSDPTPPGAGKGQAPKDEGRGGPRGRAAAACVDAEAGADPAAHPAGPARPR